MPLALLLAGCLLDRDGYEAARALLTDDDHDDYSEQEGDCDDNQASVFPGAFDGCDELDNDCDGVTDEDGGTTTWYPDRDSDGFGDEAEVSTACVAPAGWVDLGGDCDDGEALINPDADEVCGGGDEDCDGATDDGAVDAPTWYVDGDGDGYVAGLDDSVSACEAPDGYAGRDGVPRRAGGVRRRRCERLRGHDRVPVRGRERALPRRDRQ
jgi:Putative metal-binding motif